MLLPVYERSVFTAQKLLQFRRFKGSQNHACTLLAVVNIFY